MPKVADMVTAAQRRAPGFLAPICTRPATMPDGALPGAWLVPHDSDDRPVIPGDVVRRVRNYNVHCIDGVDYLSTGTVLSIMRWGDVSHVPPVALEYGRERGTYVDRASRCHDAGCLDWEAMDDRLKPYVDAWSLFKVKEPWRCEATEAAIFQSWARTFGYRDRVGLYDNYPTVLDLKTSAHIGTSYRLQLASYLGGPRDLACAVQLKKDGTYELHWLKQSMAWRRRFEQLAYEAHEYIAEEERRKRA